MDNADALIQHNSSSPNVESGYLDVYDYPVKGHLSGIDNVA